MGFPLAMAGMAALVIVFREELVPIFSSVERFRVWVQAREVIAPLVFVAAQCLQVVVFIIPGEVPQIAAGYLFGIWMGTLLSLTGIMLGSTFSFLLARLLGVPFVYALFRRESVDRLLQIGSLRPEGSRGPGSRTAAERAERLPPGGRRWGGYGNSGGLTGRRGGRRSSGGANGWWGSRRDAGGANGRHGGWSGSKPRGGLRQAVAGRARLVLFLVFLIPGIPKDVLCYAAGLTSMSLPAFLLISTPARLPGILGSAVMGKAAAQQRWVLAGAILLASMALFALGYMFRERLQALLERLSARQRRATPVERGQRHPRR